MEDTLLYLTEIGMYSPRHQQSSWNWLVDYTAVTRRKPLWYWRRICSVRPNLSLGDSLVDYTIIIQGEDILWHLTEIRICSIWDKLSLRKRGVGESRQWSEVWVVYTSGCWCTASQASRDDVKRWVDVYLSALGTPSLHLTDGWIYTSDVIAVFLAAPLPCPQPRGYTCHASVWQPATIDREGAVVTPPGQVSVPTSASLSHEDVLVTPWVRTPDWLT